MARRAFKKYERRYERVDADLEHSVRWAIDRYADEELVEVLCEFFADWLKRDREERASNLLLSLRAGGK